MMTRLRAFIVLFISCVAASPAAAQHGFISNAPSYGWRAIAGPVEIPMSIDSTNLQIMSRTPSFATDNITQIKVVFPNFYIASSGRPDSGSQAQPGSSATITASIEYPAGVCTQLKFSGSASGTIANGGQVASDALTVSIPNGATFWVREFSSAASGGTVVGNTGTSDSAHLDSADGEAVMGWASGGTDYTASCTASGSWSGGTSLTNARKPIAIVGWTQHAAVCLIGDSRVRGNNEGVLSGIPAANRWGQLDPWIGQTFGTINLGANGDRAKETSQNDGHYTNRGALLQYCTHAVYAYGINDINQNSASNTAVEGYFHTFQGLYDPSHALFWYLATVFPYANYCPGGVMFSDSSGSGGSTPTQKETARLNYNSDVRAGSITGQDGFIDIDALVAESPWPGWTGGAFGSYASCIATTTDTGLSKNITTDNLHLSQQGAGGFNGSQGWVYNAFTTAPGTFTGIRKPKALFCTDKNGAYRC